MAFRSSPSYGAPGRSNRANSRMTLFKIGSGEGGGGEINSILLHVPRERMGGASSSQAAQKQVRRLPGQLMTALRGALCQALGRTGARGSSADIRQPLSSTKRFQVLHLGLCKVPLSFSRPFAVDWTGSVCGICINIASCALSPAAPTLTRTIITLMST